MLSTKISSRCFSALILLSLVLSVGTRPAKQPIRDEEDKTVQKRPPVVIGAPDLRENTNTGTLTFQRRILDDDDDDDSKDKDHDDDDHDDKYDKHDDDKDNDHDDKEDDDDYHKNDKEDPMEQPFIIIASVLVLLLALLIFLAICCCLKRICASNTNRRSHSTLNGPSRSPDGLESARRRIRRNSGSNSRHPTDYVEHRMKTNGSNQTKLTGSKNKVAGRKEILRSDLELQNIQIGFPTEVVRDHQPVPFQPGSTRIQNGTNYPEPPSSHLQGGQQSKLPPINQITVKRD